MNCYCGAELCWGSDGDPESMGLDIAQWEMVSFLHCLNCGIAVELFTPTAEHQQELGCSPEE